MKMIRKPLILIIFLIFTFILIFSGTVCAEEHDGGLLDESTQVIEDVYVDNHYYLITGFYSPSAVSKAVTHFSIGNIETFGEVYLIKMSVPSSSVSISGSGGTFQIKNGETVVGTGSIFTWLETPTSRAIQMEFDYYDRGALTGANNLPLTLSGMSITSINRANNPAAPYVFLGFDIGGGSYKPLDTTDVEVFYKDRYYTKIYRDGALNDETNCVYINRFNLIRQEVSTGRWTYSRLRIFDNNGSIYTDTTSSSVNIYNISTITAPLTLQIDYGNPYVYTNNYTWTGSSTCFPPTPPPTPIPTATPTPSINDQLCGYWTFSVNTSNIFRNDYVQGTLTESDPDDHYDIIEWYRVLPSGQEYPARNYVYDPGFFGLGAGWYLVDPYTGTPSASSLEAALQNDIQFTTSGGVHYMRVKIFDDKSLLPTVYHDYDHICTFNQIVYVGETTQSQNQQGINVYECDTNAFLSGVSLKVYDYVTGEWTNKTSEYGGTTYFNAVPGRTMRVLAEKTGWITSDTTMTVSNPPVVYPVCLKRPLEEIENKSYAFFNVRDSVTTMGLYKAKITLSDAQTQDTLPSGYAGFSVNDNELYYYTVTKPGYQSFSSSFNISTDTSFPISLVQITATPTLTYPLTTFPTVTVPTGTITGTGTPTGSITATPTGTLGPLSRVEKTTQAADVWYRNADLISNLLFFAVIVGIMGIMSDAMGRRKGGKRR
jgi:hypothetical protein